MIMHTLWKKLTLYGKNEHFTEKTNTIRKKRTQYGKYECKKSRFIDVAKKNLRHQKSTFSL